MLNDIISLVIALWAIKKSGQTEGFAAKYTYVMLRRWPYSLN